MISTKEINIPEEFLCPISREIMTDPVVAADGHSYQKDSIKEWFSRGKLKSPLDGLNLSTTLLYDNKNLKKLIREYVSRLSKERLTELISANKDYDITTIILKAAELSSNYINRTQKNYEKIENFKIVKQVQSYLKAGNTDVLLNLSRQFSSLEDFLSEIDRELPENIHKIGDMFLCKGYDTQNSEYVSINYTSFEDVITSSEIYWNSLQLSEENQIDMKSDNPEKLEEFIPKISKDLSSINESLAENLENQINSCKTVKEKMEKIISFYFTEYNTMNQILVTKNPYNLTKIARFLHCVIYNNFHNLAGTKFTETKELTRTVNIPSHLLELYKTNSLICFTSLISTSIYNSDSQLIIDDSKKGTSNRDIPVTFKIRVKNNSFLNCALSFPSIQGSEINESTKEERVILLPYILFKISKIKKPTENTENTINACVIELEELDNRDLIKKILKPKIDKSKGIPKISVTELISAVNEKLINIFCNLKNFEMYFALQKDEFNKKITEMAKQSQSELEIEKVIDALSSNHLVTSSGIYDEKLLKNYFENYPSQKNFVESKESALEDYYLDDVEIKEKSLQYILWIDDLIFATSDTCDFIQTISRRNDNIIFFCKSNTNEGIEFLNSPEGKELLKLKNFRILEDMTRYNEEDRYYAGVNFVKAVRELGIDKQIMIFCQSKSSGEEKFKERNVSLENVVVTAIYKEVNDYILDKKPEPEIYTRFVISDLEDEN